MPVHTVLRVMAFDMAAMFALVPMNLAAVLLLVSFPHHLGITARFHDAAALGAVMTTSVAAALVVLARVMSCALVLVCPASHRVAPSKVRRSAP